MGGSINWKLAWRFLSLAEYAHACMCICKSVCLYNRKVERGLLEQTKKSKKRGGGNKRGQGDISDMKAQEELFRG